MSLFNGKTVLDDGISSLKINAISLTGALDAVFPGTGTILGSITGETGADAARETGALQATAITDASQVSAESIGELIKIIEQQMGVTQGQFAPFLEAGTGALPGVQQASTIGGLDQRIGQILGSESFQPLVQERTRSIEGLLGAGGLTRSGTAITEGAKITSDLAFEIENMLAGRESNLVNTGQTAAGQTATADSNFLSQLIQSITGQTQAITSGITGAANAQASGILGAAQSQAAGTQNLLNLGGVLGAAAISDPRLKQNAVKIGKIGDLDICSWDYIEGLEDSPLAIMKSGFMSDQVKELYPQHIIEFAGYDLINYETLLNELEPCLH